MHFANDIVIVGKLREEVNWKLELWRQTLEVHNFCLSRIKMEYMGSKLSRRRTNLCLEVKIKGHNISQVTQFKYHGSIIQNDR